MNWQAQYNTPDLLLALARAAHESGQFEDAVNLFNRCLSAIEASFGPEDIALSGVLVELAEVYESHGDTVAALQIYRRANGILVLNARELLSGNRSPHADNHSRQDALTNESEGCA